MLLGLRRQFGAYKLKLVSFVIVFSALALVIGLLGPKIVRAASDPDKKASASSTGM